MTDRIETRGKTVKEAVSEALLQMGARHDEVDIKVLEEPKSGFLGFIGNKAAKVLVTKKQKRRGSRGRDNRGYQENRSAHEFSDNNSNERSGRGPRKRPQQKRSNPNEKREADNNPDGTQDNREPSRPRRGGRNPRRDDRGDNKRNAPQRNENSGSREAQGAVDNRGTNENREASGNRDRNPRQNDQNRKDNRNRNRNPRQRDNRENKRDIESQETQPMSSSQDDIKGNTPDRNNDRRPENRPENRQERRPDSRQGERNGNRRPDGNRQDNRRPRQRDDNRRGGPRDNAGRNAPNERPRNDVPLSAIEPDEIILTGIKGTKYAASIRDITEEEICSTLEKMTGAVLARAGFPSRCEVNDGEYRQVRIVTDDNSAGMLIGRHGATVDAFEHLIERMAGMAIGDRVRMNLDINNYRRRREETLAERVEMAVARVLESGRDFHIEPMCARERRIVHLQAADNEGIRTYTLTGHNGKHVVIAPGSESDRDRFRNDEVKIVESPEEADEVLNEGSVQEADEASNETSNEAPVPEAEMSVEEETLSDNTEAEDDVTVGETYGELDNISEELESLPEDDSFSARDKYEEGFEKPQD